MMEYESSVLAIWLIHPIIQSRNDSCLDCFLNPFRFLALIPHLNPSLEILLSPLAPLGGDGLGVRESKRGKIPPSNQPEPRVEPAEPQGGIARFDLRVLVGIVSVGLRSQSRAYPTLR